MINPTRRGAGRGWIFVQLIIHCRLFSHPNSCNGACSPPDHLEVSLAFCSCIFPFSYYSYVYVLSALQRKQRKSDLWGTVTRCRWKTTHIPWGYRHAFWNATQPQQSLSSTAVCWSFSRTNHTQCYPRVNVPTPTPQRNMHHICYAQSSLKSLWLLQSELS